MKRTVSVTAVLTAAACLWVFAAAYGALRAELKVQVLPTQGQHHHPWVPPGIYPSTRTNSWVIPFAPAVRPGMYKAEPYSGIVVVPGTGLDKQFVFNPGGGHSLMPAIRPELRFVPLRRKAP